MSTMLERLTEQFEQAKSGNIELGLYIAAAAKEANESKLHKQTFTPEGQALMAKIYGAYFEAIAKNEMHIADAHVLVARHLVVALG